MHVAGRLRVARIRMAPPVQIRQEVGLHIERVFVPSSPQPNNIHGIIHSVNCHSRTQQFIKYSAGIFIAPLHTQQSKKQTLRIVNPFGDYQVGTDTSYRQDKKIQTWIALLVAGVVVVQCVVGDIVGSGIAQGRAISTAHLGGNLLIKFIRTDDIDRVIKGVLIEFCQVFQTTNDLPGPGFMEVFHFKNSF
ncbi:TPA: hypothetical protein MIO78_25605 [Klebsiella pneumoniae subsp. pneumoniae]|nr:hypothetical protein [Klebsiella pneumoniae subsp. pneumoniae]